MRERSRIRRLCHRPSFRLIQYVAALTGKEARDGSRSRVIELFTSVFQGKLPWQSAQVGEE